MNNLKLWMKIFLTIGLLLLTFLVFPANSPIHISRDLKVIPATIIIILLISMWFFKSDKKSINEEHEDKDA